MTGLQVSQPERCYVAERFRRRTGQGAASATVVAQDFVGLEPGQAMLDPSADLAVLGVVVLLPLGQFTAVTRLRYGMITSGLPR